MAITSAMANSFKKELFEAKHNFLLSGGNTFKLALIKSGMAGTYGAASTNYSDITGNSDEVANSGSYSAGGGTLTRIDPALDTSTGIVDFADISFTTATISADGCMIYDTTDTNSACGVFDFGGTYASTAGTFSITMPAAAAATAILRIA